MKAFGFDYVQARSADHAVELMEGFEGFGKFLAGGQSLGPMLNLRLTQPGLLIDVRRCDDLRFCVDEGDAVVYGAALTHAELEDGAVIDVTDGYLRYAASRIAYRAVRNRGTLGGSIAHADPAADWLTVMLVLDAEVVLIGPEGTRTEKLSNFVRGPFETRLRVSDLILGLRLTKPVKGTRFGYHKLSVKEGEFAEAFCTASHTQTGRSEDARIVIGAIERVPVILEGSAALDIVETAPTLAACEAAVHGAVGGLAPPALRLHAATMRRAITQPWPGESR